jgi:hypothetical protein
LTKIDTKKSNCGTQIIVMKNFKKVHRIMWITTAAGTEGDAEAPWSV